MPQTITISAVKIRILPKVTLNLSNFESGATVARIAGFDLDPKGGGSLQQRAPLKPLKRLHDAWFA
jgi:hypothetical protein